MMVDRVPRDCAAQLLWQNFLPLTPAAQAR